MGGNQANSSGSHGGFDFSQNMDASEAGSSGSPSGFDYSKYMGGGSSEGSGGFDYSQYMSGRNGSSDAMKNYVGSEGKDTSKLGNAAVEKGKYDVQLAVSMPQKTNKIGLGAKFVLYILM